MQQDSLGEAYFARLYAANDDPWSFEENPYELEKYDATLAALGDRRFRCGFEIGCSIGILTAMLASRCDTLLSIDISERALDLARTRCRGLANVHFEKMTFPRDVPNDRFDLIVLSEVAYYWSDRDLSAAKNCIARAAAGGTLELVHFLPKVDEYVRDGDSVHLAFLDDGRFASVRAVRRDKYRIDVLHVAD